MVKIKDETVQSVPGKGGKKARHLSRKAQYTAYNFEGRHLKNKKRRLVRHIKRLPNDLQAQSVLAKL